MAKMKNRRLAERIVVSFGKNSAPGSCTWGDEHPQAHSDLFGGEYDKNPSAYVEDMVLDVEKILNRAR